MLGKAKKRKPTRVDSLIGQQSRVLGDIRFGGGLHVDGTIKGNVSAEGDERATLTVSDRGTIEGEVRVPYIILNGVVKGDVYANEHVGAEVNGKLVRIVEESRPPLALDHDAGFEDAEKP